MSRGPANSSLGQHVHVHTRVCPSRSPLPFVPTSDFSLSTLPFQRRHFRSPRGLPRDPAPCYWAPVAQALSSPLRRQSQDRVGACRSSRKREVSELAPGDRGPVTCLPWVSVSFSGKRVQDPITTAGRGCFGTRLPGEHWRSVRKESSHC